MMTEKVYASAFADFLDRDSQTIKIGVMYPITRIELRNGDDPNVIERTFIVGENGKWIEKQ